MNALPAGKDSSDIAATLATWSSKGRKHRARLVRNYAGAAMLLQEKNGKPCGSLPIRGNDAAALAYAQALIPRLFDAHMTLAA